MNPSRLLVDIEVLEFLRTLRRQAQEDLLRRFREIAAFPANHSDYAADRQVKILDVYLADRGR